MKKLLTIATIIALTDQATKLAVEKLGIWHTLNNGMLLGTIENVNTAAAIASLAALTLAAYHYKKLPKHWLPKTSTALITGGLAGNLIDRIMLGSVVDFIKIWNFPVFNIADIAITAGIIGLIGYWIVDGRRWNVDSRQ